ncbi:hypothetical protein C3D80_20230 [Cronobacter sakazakii]|uniref:hypothetical protein n=1 Tax=Cronobacter sakazakii TaxID=28141 RepID=UPI0009BC0B7C|nr:hypothetical protein [Cronobacter sakazakii]EJJ0671701.1 hypothetical protein [Cronobacter sakazakii]EMC4401963.1 hypothetical protein [Cronobacter sakazakii]MCI0323071.1 hypothetical protein [Cronobacter sakazakii]MCZ6132187.1 hypothetical protein [Cronobacter sakazakii]MCZ6139890.1 hypothetical protein [Cronobacter sakazakii]
MNGRGEVVGVKGYKQIVLKKFSKIISHNLRLLALSRDLNLYELHDQIVDDFLNDTPEALVEPQGTDGHLYNVFVGPEVQQRAAALSAKLNVPESEIVYSALVTFADKLQLSQPLN